MRLRHFLLNRWVHFVLLFAMLLGATSFSMSDNPLRQRIQNAAFDRLNVMYPRPATDKLVIVDLDEESLDRIGQWPWPRDVVAQMVRNINKAGAKAIGLDMVFAEIDRTSPKQVAARIDNRVDSQVTQTLRELPSNDTIFAKTLQKANNVVTGFTAASNIKTTRRKPVLAQPVYFPRMRDVHKRFVNRSYSPPGLATNLPLIAKSAAGNGAFIVKPGIDSIVRKVPLLLSFPDPALLKAGKAQDLAPARLYPALALETFRVTQGANTPLYVRPKDEVGVFDKPYYLSTSMMGRGARIPINESGQFRVYFRDVKQSEYIPAHKLLGDKVAEDVRRRVEDKIVLVGTSAEGLRDIRSTPLDIFVPGVEVHLNIVEQILQGNYLHRAAFANQIEALAIFLTGLILIAAAPFAGALLLAALTVAVTGGLFGLSWYSFTEHHILLDPLYPSGAIVGIFLAANILAFIRTEADRKQIRDAFSLYISPAYLQELSKNPEKLKLGGQTRELTVMFTDIRKFSTISESMSPEELIRTMNDFLTPMTDCVMNWRGTIDKYIGDAMMAFWNAPLDDPDHPWHACMAALAMQDALEPVNEELRRRAEANGEGEPIPLRAGIGMHTGPAFVGNMGSRQRFSYSALGDSVNLASRLEGQTKSYGVNILISEETYQQAGGADHLAAVELDLLRVVGKSEPVRIYALLDRAEVVAGHTAYQQWLSTHTAMLDAYRQQAFDKALELIEQCRQQAMYDLEAYYSMMQARITELKQTPPPESWDGVYDAEEK